MTIPKRTVRELAVGERNALDEAGATCRRLGRGRCDKPPVYEVSSSYIGLHGKTTERRLLCKQHAEAR